jgi:hypothetical protein
MKPREQYAILVAYLMMKAQTRDWHAVADAAMDLREMVVRHPEVEPRS